MKETNIDIKENSILKISKELLEILLKDMTSKKNILWATDTYQSRGYGYSAKDEIKIEQITSRNGNVIKPRTEKSKAEQQSRICDKAEVFTPSWICNEQNNLVDDEWFNRKDVFNTQKEKSWKATSGRIKFPDTEKKTWKDYVSSRRMEITCGEAPYITSRYDSVTGEYIEVKERIGLLDRKLRVVNENTETLEDWLTWAYIAVQNIYGFDWQGDNVLIARENILFDVKEFYEDKFGKTLETEDLVNFAKVIVWNIWQMDGLKFVIPNTCCTETKTETTLFETVTISKECEGCKKNNNFKHNGIYCYVKDWETHKKVRFADLLKNKE